jgi:hypothetical protein
MPKYVWCRERVIDRWLLVSENLCPIGKVPEPEVASRLGQSVIEMGL